MGEVINLNRTRKAKAAEKQKAKAATNRASHGRTQAQKALERARADKASRDLDDHKREQ